jgi:vacuolar protein sorting-associated protein 52
LGDRLNVIDSDIESSILIPHASQKSDQKYSVEAIFRSEQFALLDNACNENLFINDFFIVKEKAGIDLFMAAFGKTFNLFVKIVENNFQLSFDAIGLFLCIQIIQRYRIIATRRNCIPIISYYENIIEFLWQRFEYVMQQHVHSITLIDTHKLHSLDIRPHYITRRYAEFSTTLLSINDSLPSPRLYTTLTQLQIEVQNFILRLASEFSQRKDQLISLINNYDLMLSVILEKFKEDNRESQNIKELLSSRVNDYVEEVLITYFANLICFVKDCEIIIEKDNLNQLKSYESHVSPLVKSFLNDWKKSLDLINQEIMRSFSNFKNGQNILQATLSQLIQYYHRFSKILSHNSFKHLTIRNELISTTHLMIEIKKHKPTF